MSHSNSPLHGAKRFATLALLAGAATLLGAGCKAMNENPNNERFWFPTLAPPTAAEREARASKFLDGGDPYLDAQVGPRSFDTRPRTWDISRSRTSQVVGEAPDIIDD